MVRSYEASDYQQNSTNTRSSEASIERETNLKSIDKHTTTNIELTNLFENRSIERARAA